jgi:hypothetical protein
MRGRELVLLFSMALVLCHCGDSTDEPDGGSTTPDAGSMDDGGMVTPDAGTDAGTVAPTCELPEADRSGTDVYAHPDGSGDETRVTVTGTDPCARSYLVTTDATPLNGFPAMRRRAIEESAGAVNVRSGHDLFDVLYQVARADLADLSVAEYVDPQLEMGEPVTCGALGCFVTNREDRSVRTSEIGYALDLGVAPHDPLRALQTLYVRLSQNRDRRNEQVMQDPGTGGSWPIALDRASWALGAQATASVLVDAERGAFLARATPALVQTLRDDRIVGRDPSDGLYRGEATFLNQREQTYPEWVLREPQFLTTSKALSTNLVQYRALQIVAGWAEAAGDTAVRDELNGYAAELRGAIRAGFWDPTAGLFRAYRTTGTDPGPNGRLDLLGSALAVIYGVAEPAEALQVLSNYPHQGFGAPVQFPESQSVRILMNRGEWPFVEAYWMRAAAVADHPAVYDRMFDAIYRGMAVNLSALRAFEIQSGRYFVPEDAALQGPLPNSTQDLRSVAAYLSMVQHSLFGLRFGLDGVEVDPYVTRALRRGFFGGTDRLVLNDLPVRDRRLTVVVRLPQPNASGNGRLTVSAVTLDGEAVTGAIPYGDLDAEGSIVEVTLTDDGVANGATLREFEAEDSFRLFFAPATPRMRSVDPSGFANEFLLSFELSQGPGTPAALFNSVTANVYRDGEVVLTGIAPTNPGIIPFTEVVDDTIAGEPSGLFVCYSVELCWTDTGLCSHRSAPLCHVPTFASRSAAVGGSGIRLELQAERSEDPVGVIGDANSFYYENFGSVAGDALTTSTLSPLPDAGLATVAIRVRYRNPNGTTEDGITAGVYRLTVSSGGVTDSDWMILPHRANPNEFGFSDFVFFQVPGNSVWSVRLETVSDLQNMSFLRGYETFPPAAEELPLPTNVTHITSMDIIQVVD